MSEFTRRQSTVLSGAPVVASARLVELIEWSAREVPNPLTLLVTSGGDDVQLRLTERLRVLPGRRLVCSGSLVEQDSDDRQIVVKWFFGKAAARYADRESRGVAAMHSAGMPTPALLASWRLASTPVAPEASALVFERLPNVQPLDDELLTQRPVLWSVLWSLLARLHLAGVTHTDLHFGNLLYTPLPAGSPSEQASQPQPGNEQVDHDQLWLIDGDGVRRVAEQELPLAASLQAFVELVAQTRRSVPIDALREHWARYCDARGWSADQPGLTVLERRYRAARRARVEHFQAKTRRTCTAFAKRKTIRGTALVDRDWLRSVAVSQTADLPVDSASQANSLRELLVWLDALPDLMSRQTARPGDGASETSLVPGPPLKAGNTATVVLVGWRGLRLVVKRYNNKSWWHRLRRLIRPNRGLNSWVFAHTLRFVGIPTARAVALLRTRLGGPTYLVMEASTGVELNIAHLEANAPLCQRLVALLDGLGAEGLVHNDTKASNFLWDSIDDSLTVIDLDAMQMPKSRRDQLSGQRRDRRRLLRNFAATPELQRRFRGALGL